MALQKSQLKNLYRGYHTTKVTFMLPTDIVPLEEGASGVDQPKNIDSNQPNPMLVGGAGGVVGGSVSFLLSQMGTQASIEKATLAVETRHKVVIDGYESVIKARDIKIATLTQQMEKNVTKEAPKASRVVTETLEGAAKGISRTSVMNLCKNTVVATAVGTGTALIVTDVYGVGKEKVISYFSSDSESSDSDEEVNNSASSRTKSLRVDTTSTPTASSMASSTASSAKNSTGFFTDSPINHQ